MNRVKEILRVKGFAMFEPTDELLSALGIDKARLQRILSNRVKMTAVEAVRFAKWLEVPVESVVNE